MGFHMHGAPVGMFGAQPAPEPERSESEASVSVSAISADTPVVLSVPTSLQKPSVSLETEDFSSVDGSTLTWMRSLDEQRSDRTPAPSTTLETTEGSRHLGDTDRASMTLPTGARDTDDEQVSEDEMLESSVSVHSSLFDFQEETADEVLHTAEISPRGGRSGMYARSLSVWFFTFG